MALSYVVNNYPEGTSGAAETFTLASADQAAFPRFFGFSLTSLKAALQSGAVGLGMADPSIKAAVQGLIQASLIGGGASVGAATARAAVIVDRGNGSAARSNELALLILADVGA